LNRLPDAGGNALAMSQRSAEPPDALRERKQVLRRRVLGERAALDRAEHARLSRTITARLLELPEFARASCVLAYLSFGTELDTREFVAALQGRGCALVLPRINLAERTLALYRVSDPEAQTVAGVWGIREPDPAQCALAEPRAIEAVLVPGVVFTPRCDRVGYGGGFYDALIRDWSQPPPLIAAAFDLQVAGDVPVGPGDYAVDSVITETASYSRRAG